MINTATAILKYPTTGDKCNLKNHPHILSGYTFKCSFKGTHFDTREQLLLARCLASSAKFANTACSALSVDLALSS